MDLIKIPNWKCEVQSKLESLNLPIWGYWTTIFNCYSYVCLDFGLGILWKCSTFFIRNKKYNQIGIIRLPQSI